MWCRKNTDERTWWHVLCCALFTLVLLPSFAFAKDDCEKIMAGTYYVTPYSEPSGIHHIAIELLNDDPMNGKPVFHVEKKGAELVHIGATSGKAFGIEVIDADDKNIFNQEAGRDITKCGYEIEGSDIKVLYVDLKKADKEQVKELYDYFTEIWSRFGRVSGDSRFLTKVPTRKMTLKAFTKTKYFLYNEYSDGVIGIGLLVPLEKR